MLDFSGAVDVYERLLVERPEHVEALNRLKRRWFVQEASRFVEVIERSVFAEPPQDVLTFVDGAGQCNGELGLAVGLWLQC